MGPLATMMLLYLGKAAIQGGAALYKTPQEQKDADEAEDLRKKYEMGALGYSQADYTKDIEAQIAPTRALREQQADKAAAVRGTALAEGSGAMLKEATIMDEAGAQLRREAAASAAGRSFQKAGQQEQRMYKLEAGVSQSQQDTMEGLATTASSVLDAGGEYLDAKLLLEGEKLSGEEMASLSKMTGLDEKETEMFYKFAKDNPKVADAWMELMFSRQNDATEPVVGGQ